MTYYKNRIVLTIFHALFWIGLSAQDIHFSHIHSTPTFLNPAMTGLFNGDVRFIGNYRSQWENFTRGYRTAMGSADMKLVYLGKRDFIGGGINVFNDKAGDLEFSTNSVQLNFSLIKALDYRGDHFISFGLANAFVSNRVSYENLIVFDQTPEINGQVGDQASYWDMSAGLSWFYSFRRDNFVYLGASYFHLNKPQISLYNTSYGEAFPLYRKIILHGGADINPGGDFALKPSFIFMDQGPHKEITIGTFVKYNYEKRSRQLKGSGVYLGAWLRWYVENDIRGVDAVVLSLRFDFDDVFLTFSFDSNISKLTAASNGVGGPEFSVVKILETPYRGKQKVSCPAF